ncbi:Veg family protein [Clostridium tertium]|uniref:Veg family protein n=1 Tax=Clostridium tertium TaxID=1559 RepID=UPI00374E385F
MFNKKDIELLKKRLIIECGKTIVIRCNHNKGTNKNEIKEFIIENVSENVLILRRINKNIGLIESYTFVDILSGSIDIIDIR